jgi:hypothetical protein
VVDVAAAAAATAAAAVAVAVHPDPVLMTAWEVYLCGVSHHKKTGQQAPVLRTKERANDL